MKSKKLQKLVIIGGSHAFWEINELIKDINAVEQTYEVIDVLDDNVSLHGKRYNDLTVTGPIDLAKNYNKDVNFIFAIGSYSTRLIRAEILDRLNISENRFETLVHPTVKIFSTSSVGNGCIVHYGTVIFNHTVINDFTVIAANCVIAVGNIIGKGALFGSNVTTTTGVMIGSYSFIGSSSSIGENIEIGPGSQVGMSSLVLKNIGAGCFILGNPSRTLSKVEVSEKIIADWGNEKSKKKLEL